MRPAEHHVCVCACVCATSCNPLLLALGAAHKHSVVSKLSVLIVCGTLLCATLVSSLHDTHQGTHSPGCLMSPQTLTGSQSTWQQTSKHPQAQHSLLLCPKDALRMQVGPPSLTGTRQAKEGRASPTGKKRKPVTAQSPGQKHEPCVCLLLLCCCTTAVGCAPLARSVTRTAQIPHTKHCGRVGCGQPLTHC